MRIHRLGGATTLIASLLVTALAASGSAASCSASPQDLSTDPNLHAIVLGDSIAAGRNLPDSTQWWQYQLTQLLRAADPAHKFSVRNAARGGTNLQWSQDKVNAMDLSPYNLALVIVGRHDADNPGPDYVARLQTLIATLENARIRVLMATSPPNYVDGGFPAGPQTEMADLIRAAAGSHLVDLKDSWWNIGPQLVGPLYADTVHQSALGQRLIARLMLQALEARGWLQVAPALPTVTLTAPAETRSPTIPIGFSTTDPVGFGILDYYVSEDPTPPVFEGSMWSNTAPTTFDLSPGDGARTLHAWVEDWAGNISAVYTTTVTLDRVPPVARPPTVALAAGIHLGSTVPVSVSWAPAIDANGIAAYHLQQTSDGQTWTPVNLPTPTALRTTVQLSTGKTYTFRLSADDLAGNAGGWATGSRVSPGLFQENAPSVSVAGGFVRSTLTGASSGKVARCGLKTCRATLAFTGSAVAFVSTRGPNRGIARLKLDGVTVGLVDLYASTLRPASVVYATSVTPGRHVLSVTVTATHNAASTGSRVDVDAFEVLVPGG